MPAPLNLSGHQIGKLTVLGPASDNKPRSWHVQCECGTIETYPQRRLRERNRRDYVTACSRCRSKVCAVCGAAIPASSTKATCSRACHVAHRRAIALDSHNRHRERRNAENRMRARRRSELLRANPELAAVVREQRREWRRAFADRLGRDEINRRNRSYYQRARERIDALPEPERSQRLAEWRERRRMRMRRYFDSLRTERPEAYRRYLEQLYTARGRRELTRLMIELTEKIDE